MNLFTSLIPPPWNIVARIALYALLVTALIGFGYVKGIEKEQNKQLKNVITEQQTVIRIHDKQTVIDTKTVNKLQSELTLLRKKNDELQKSIESVPDTCVLSPDWVRNYNSSIKLQDARSASGPTTTH